MTCPAKHVRQSMETKVTQRPVGSGSAVGTTAPGSMRRVEKKVASMLTMDSSVKTVSKIEHTVLMKML